VDDHPDPLGELRRLLNIQRAYTFMNQGDEYLGHDRVDDALAAYRAAAALAPDMLELPFWHAVTLADLGRVDEALVIFKSIFLSEPQWRELLKRLPAAGLLREDPQMMDKLISI
jgi:tetratricopeptide (TPR) repeat protein